MAGSSIGSAVDISTPETLTIVVNGNNNLRINDSSNASKPLARNR